MNPDFLNLKEAAEEAEFEEVNPRPIKLQNSGLSGASASGSTAVYNKTAHSTLTSDCRSEFNKAQYEANSTVDIDSLISTETEQEQDEPKAKWFPRNYRHGNTKTLKAANLESKRIAKRKAQRKAQRKARKSNR